MSPRFLLAVCLLAGLAGTARPDDPSDEARRLRAENQKLREALEQQEKQVQETVRELMALRKAVEEHRRQAAAARDQAQVELKRAEEALAAIKEQERRWTAQIADLKTAVEGRPEQVRKLTQALDELRKERLELISRINDERKGRAQADIETRAIRDRNARLEAELKELARELTRARAGGGTVIRKVGEENPPVENVQGRVVDVDHEQGLFTISIGSDAGLVKGHTLKVFRLAPIPEETKYLGTLEVLSVTPHKAVARFTTKTAVPVRPGDHVASRLLTPEKK
jgi:hypothetical protein